LGWTGRAVSTQHEHPERLTTKGYADTVPRVANDSPENRAKNRPVELRKLDCRE